MAVWIGADCVAGDELAVEVLPRPTGAIA